MNKYAHKGCGEVVAEYIGTERVGYGLVLKAADWLVFGKHPEENSSAAFVCPKCGERIGISSQFLEEVE